MQQMSAVMRAALTGPVLVVDFGVDLLDGNDVPVEDISADVLSLSVERSMYADVHGSCTLSLLRDLVWGVDRVRPWVSVDGHRWNLGVFLLTSPDVVAGESPRARSVTGVDKLWLLQREVGDTYVVAAGTSYLDAIRQVLVDAGVTGGLLLDGDRQGTALSEPGVWLLTDQPSSWLRVINDLLSMIGYRGLWVDENGRFRSEPYRPPTERAPVWAFDTTDTLAGIVGEDRTLSADVYAQVNHWRFVRKMDTTPAEGAGIYTVDRSAGEPYVRRKTLFLDVADQAALVAEGDRVVAEDTANVRVASFQSGPLPLTHFDVVNLKDLELGAWGKGQVRRWSIDDSGAMDVEVEILG